MNWSMYSRLFYKQNQRGCNRCCFVITCVCRKQTSSLQLFWAGTLLPFINDSPCVVKNSTIKMIVDDMKVYWSVMSELRFLYFNRIWMLCTGGVECMHWHCFCFWEKQLEKKQNRNRNRSNKNRWPVSVICSVFRKNRKQLFFSKNGCFNSCFFCFFLTSSISNRKENIFLLNPFSCIQKMSNFV